MFEPKAGTPSTPAIEGMYSAKTEGGKRRASD